VALVIWIYSFGFTFIIMKVLDIIMGLRLSENKENAGFDLSQHGERGYIN
jgi:Amt family ammonium transporter